MAATDPTPDVVDPLQTFDAADLAELLKVSRKWVEDKVAAREIPFTRLPGDRLVRFTREQVEEIFAAGAKSVDDLPRTRRIAQVAPRRGRGRAA